MSKINVQMVKFEEFSVDSRILHYGFVFKQKKVMTKELELM